MPHYELETRPFIQLLNQLQNIARVISYVNNELYNIICIMTSTDSLYKGYLLPPDSTAKRWHHRSPHSNDVVSTTAGSTATTKHLYLLEKQDLTTGLHSIVLYRGI